MFRIIAIFCIMIAGPVMGQGFSNHGGMEVAQNKVSEWQKKNNYIVTALASMGQMKMELDYWKTRGWFDANAIRGNTQFCIRNIEEQCIIRSNSVAEYPHRWQSWDVDIDAEIVDFLREVEGKFHQLLGDIREAATYGISQYITRAKKVDEAICNFERSIELMSRKCEGLMNWIDKLK